MTAFGLAAGGLALAGQRAGPAFVIACGTGLVLAAVSSALGFAWLQRHLFAEGSGFAGILLGLFLGRVALVGVFGLALHAVAPAHLAAALMSLVGFHFVFTVLEVALLARSPRARRGRTSVGRL